MLGFYGSGWSLGGACWDFAVRVGASAVRVGISQFVLELPRFRVGRCVLCCTVLLRVGGAGRVRSISDIYIYIYIYVSLIP